MFNEIEEAALKSIADLRRELSFMPYSEKQQAYTRLREVGALIKQSAYDRFRGLTFKQSIEHLIRMHNPGAENISFNIEFNSIKKTPEVISSHGTNAVMGKMKKTN